MLCLALRFACDPCQEPHGKLAEVGSFCLSMTQAGSWELCLHVNIIYPGCSEAACISAALAACDKWNLLFIIPDSKYRPEDSKSTAAVRAVSMNENCKIKTDSTEQCVLFLIWNKEMWKLIHIQTKTNDSCRNWKTVLTVTCVSLGDVSSSLSTWRWRTSLATGSICCLNIPKSWLTKWKGGRATARSLLDSWKQNCRDFSVFLSGSNWSLWKSEDQY